MGKVVEFFFDCSSPWTYLAFSQIECLAADADATLVWKPILVGGVFNAVNQSVYEQRANPQPQKARYMMKDLQDWAQAYGLVIKWPSIFPVRAVAPMRAIVAASAYEKAVALSGALFHAYWGENQDIADPAVLARLCAAVGLDWAAIDDAMQSDDVKRQLKLNTQELIDRGGFGSPTIFIDGDDMYFGNDRLFLVERALAR